MLLPNVLAVSLKKLRGKITRIQAEILPKKANIGKNTRNQAEIFPGIVEQGNPASK